MCSASSCFGLNEPMGRPALLWPPTSARRPTDPFTNRNRLLAISSPYSDLENTILSISLSTSAEPMSRADASKRASMSESFRRDGRSYLASLSPPSLLFHLCSNVVFPTSRRWLRCEAAADISLRAVCLMWSQACCRWRSGPLEPPLRSSCFPPPTSTPSLSRSLPSTAPAAVPSSSEPRYGRLYSTSNSRSAWKTSSVSSAEC